MATGIDTLHQRFWVRRSPEERLLLLCTRQRLDRQQEAEITKLCNNHRLSWETVLATAVAHQVSPLVFHNLAQCEMASKADMPDKPDMPEGVRNAFHHEMVGNLAAKDAMAGALGNALGWFRLHDLDVMLVKGTALDHRVYEEPWYTISGDIDLLLRPSDEPIGKELWSKLVEMNAGRPVIDVHRGRHPDLVMNGVLPVDFTRIWADAEQTTVGEQPAWLMAIEHELVCACINSCRKRYFRLKSLCEIAELIRRYPDLSFDAVAQRATDWRCRGIVYTALVATKIAVGCELPEDLGQKLGFAGMSGSLLRFLLARMSFSSLPRLYRSRRVLGKNLGRSLALPYASLGWWRGLGSLRVAGSQMVRQPAGST